MVSYIIGLIYYYDQLLLYYTVYQCVKFYICSWVTGIVDLLQILAVLYLCWKK